MIHILFGLIGFDYKCGSYKTKFYVGDDERIAKTFVLFCGLFGIVYSNEVASRKFMTYNSFPLEKREKIANADLYISEERKKNYDNLKKELDELYEDRIESAIEREHNTQRLLAETNTKVYELKTTIKTILEIKNGK